MSEYVLTHADGRPYGMGRKAYVRMVDTRGFRNWVKERNQNAGTESDDVGAMGFICAQVVGRATLKQISDHYGIDYGLLWDFVNVTPERVERYRLAQRGMAEYLAGETLEIADEINPLTGEREAGSGDAARDKIRIEQRNKLMKAWNKERYGDSDAALGAGLENLAAVLERISERKRAAIVHDAEVVYEEGKGRQGEAAEEVLVIADASDGSVASEPPEPRYI